MVDAAVFELNGTTLAALGTIMGVLAGAITFLMKQLLSSKDNQITDLKGQLNEQRDELVADRDYWRNFAMRMLDPAEKALSMAERARQQQEIGLSTSAEMTLAARLKALEASVAAGRARKATGGDVKP